jgi:hypothetical protein
MSRVIPKGTLYDHARKIVEDDKKWTGLWLGTGSTKTRIYLMLARGKTLVVCLKNERDEKKFYKEIEKIREHMPSFNLDLTVISKEDFARDCDTLGTYDTVIIDEAHRFLGTATRERYVGPRGAKRSQIAVTQLHEKLYAYIQKNRPERFYMGTASIMKDPLTVWAAARMYGINLNFYEFRMQYYFPIGKGFQQNWKVRTNQFLKDMLTELAHSFGYVGRLNDYFDVPDQIYKTITVELTPDQVKALKRADVDYPDPNERLMKYHQIQNGILLGNEYVPDVLIKDNKCDQIIELAQEFPMVTVFARYTKQIEKIAAEVTKHFPSKKVFILNSNCKDREKLFAEAQSCDDYVFISQIQISEGWELKECPVMIFASINKSVVNYLQACGRIQRADRIKKNMYVRLQANHKVDMGYFKAIDQKKDFDEALYAKKWFAQTDAKKN